MEIIQTCFTTIEVESRVLKEFLHFETLQALLNKIIFNIYMSSPTVRTAMSTYLHVQDGNVFLNIIQPMSEHDLFCCVMPRQVNTTNQISLFQMK